MTAIAGAAHVAAPLGRVGHAKDEPAGGTHLHPALDVIDFELPAALEASEPPEARGLRRDEVKLLVGRRQSLELRHARFVDLPLFLESGDLLVVNTSATLPAAVDVLGPDGIVLLMHVSTTLPAGLTIVELRRPAQPASLPWSGGRSGMTVSLPGGATAELLAPYGAPGRLWIAVMHLPEPLPRWLTRHGRPIRYRHVVRDWPLACYQTVFAIEPGSAEMPSAARPFTAELVAGLVASGVQVAPLLLHTGVSSQEVHELPYPEYYRVPAATAQLVNLTRNDGGRIIAVGTTVVRALETVADARGRVHPGDGWTDTVITAQRGVRAVDGLITGWHEPAATHLAMLEAIAGRPLLERSYTEAVARGYHWHEFGDSHLILP
jgi:S-adenosylmethionine:tRNA ribosyltransferase-isomerase